MTDIFMQKELTPAEQVHHFCTLITRTGDDAFGLLISTLNRVNQKHIADELLRIEREGCVHTCICKTKIKEK